MTPAFSILVLGLDQLLLETRVSVLRQAGFRVEAATSLDEARDREPDLLILCHSFSGNERLAALRSVADSSPSTRRLCMVPAEGAFEGLTEVFNSFEGPARLVAAVKKMLPPENNHRK